MKKILLFIALTITGFAGWTQSNVDVRGDSFRAYKNGGYMEFVLRNRTKDSTGGVLMNVGNGITQYKRSRAISPTQFTVGGDTITFGGAAAGLQDVLNTSDVVDSFHMRRSSDSSQWIAIFNNGGSTDFISDTILSFFPSGTFGVQSVLDIRPLVSTFRSSVFVSNTGGVPGAMLHVRDADFDTGIYGETSGSAFGSKWGVVGSSSGGVNNYGVEGIGIGGIGNNASFRSNSPGTWAVNNWSYLGLSAATSLFTGPITTGALNSSLQASKYQFEDWGSMGLISDSIPTVSADAADLTMLVIDTSLASTGITQLLKVKLGINASASLNFADTTPGSSTDLTIAATGAVDGDPVVLGTPNASIVASGVFTAWVSSADVVTVRFTNTQTVGNLNPASGTFKVRVLK